MGVGVLVLTVYVSWSLLCLWRFVSVAGHKIRLQIEKSPFPDTVPGLHHKKPAEVRLDKKDVIMRLKK